MSRVSIVIPAYNPGAFLDEALASVLAQTFQDWECVVVDDGSREDLSRVDDLDPRMRRVRQENRGLPIARNVGILATDGEYLAFLDADDVWLPDKLAAQIALLDANRDAALCHAAFDIIDEKSQVVKSGWARPIASYAELLSNSWICVSTVMVRRSCLAVSGLFDPLRRACEDYDMWLKLARFYEMEFVADKSALYRVHSSNMSGDPALMAREVTLVLNRHIRLAGERGDKATKNEIRRSIHQARVGWGCNAYDKARAQVGQRDISATSRHLALSLRLAPLYTLKQLLLFLPARLRSKGSRS